MSVKPGDCVERSGAMRQIAGRVARVWSEDGAEFAEVWWTDGRNPTTERVTALIKIPDEECRRGRVPR